MNSIILCEGRTDAILLSYYLERVYGWKHSKKIPKPKQGALESTLLDSLSENVYDKNIVNKCQKFISGIRSETTKYISSDRLALKAHLSSVFAVMSPEKVFSTLDVVIKNTPWEKSETLKECFQILGEL